MENKVSVIIASAGSGARCGLGYNKLLYKILDRTILEFTIAKFVGLDDVNEIIVVASETDYGEVKKIVAAMMVNANIKVALGGRTRSLSIKNALAIVDDNSDIVLIHDGARPYVEESDILKVIESAAREGGAILARPMIDTIKYRDANSEIRNVKREDYICATTPQGFSRELIQKAYQSVDYNSSFTDDSEVYLSNTRGHLVCVMQENKNDKITTEEDIIEFEEYVYAKYGKLYHKSYSGNYGIGFDVHPLVEGRKLILGGVEIPFEKGLDGHSDADALVHSIMDAILTSVGEDDIGHLFPDTDSHFKGADSCRLLKKVMEILTKKGLKIKNVSATIMAEAPKMSPYIEQMRDRLAKVMTMSKNHIAISATTTEKLGIVGEGKGIACQAVISLY